MCSSGRMNGYINGNQRSTGVMKYKYRMKPPPLKQQKRRHPSHLMYLFLFCLAVFTWFILSISLMAGDIGSLQHNAELSSIYPSKKDGNKINNNRDIDDNDKFLPPSIGLKFDWNANNKEDLHRLLKNSITDKTHNNDDNELDDDDDHEHILPIKHRKQSTRGVKDDTTATTATPKMALSSSDTTTNKSLANSTKLVLLSVCIPGDRFSSEYIHASFYNKQAFCDKWGVECILSSERLAPEVPPPPPPKTTPSRYSSPYKKANPSTTTKVTTTTSTTTSTKETTTKKTPTKLLKPYSPKWEKLYLLNRTLHTHPHADWLMWLDCDAAFTNLDINWKEHLHLYLHDKTKVLIASKDKGGINLGVFFIPNTPPSKQLMKLLYEERHHVEKYKFYLKDQVALKRVLKVRPQILKYIYADVPQRIINSVSSSR
jgi:hypothetical protein